MNTDQFAGMTPDQARLFMAAAKPQAVRARLAELVAGREVIDVGCGKAEECELYDPNMYTGIDCSPELVRLARLAHPSHQFAVRRAQEVRFRWPVAIMKAVLEHLPPDEAVAVYDHVRAMSDVLYLAWHWEPGVEKLTSYKEFGATWVQNRHDVARFEGIEQREVVGPHVIWTVR